MNESISILKGIHPGAILERELKKKNLKQGPFALSLNEYPQTINAIIKGKRDMNLGLSLKIEERLEMEEGFLMTLQLHYDIKKQKQSFSTFNHPDLSLIRPVIFWDTQIDKIDWEKQKLAVIKRIFERGNEEEKQEIIRFYGLETVQSVIGKLK
ncbi:helix-turn-helix transcriptional regulator [Solitalea canadensis]|uniref:Plasmid maintenance system antidote protein n=1 Tax=Solitalea canadensis (strain ATCC 29591 / DSM 3403 / JCM 21819 / LMG 8368 / NBRC 15130 / NCIMB 12057 / USAM 9D) TaxID=929556 RepID=H8KS82_SOLCM|nr:transcriptional regulator [Solitalea canadensis]AFD07870.1 plasmid maintenance system antidote protein [Solitalea canadensis DSM 3403]